MKKHKGQSVVEFALVLPLFLFIMFGIIYSGMMFHDYITLSNIARSCSRDVAISAKDSSVSIGDAKTYYTPQLNSLMTSFYKPVGADPITINIKQNENGDVIQTTINMQLNVDGFFVDMILPKGFGVQYYMKKEPFTSSSSSSSSTSP